MQFTHVTGLVQPCGYCGIPCTGTVFIWYEREVERIAVEIDTPTVATLFSALWSGEGAPEYPHLPSIVRHWNELIGWSDGASSNGVAYPAVELRSLALALRSLHLEDARCQEIVNALGALADAAIALDTSVWLLDD